MGTSADMASMKARCAACGCKKCGAPRMLMREHHLNSELAIKFEAEVMQNEALNSLAFKVTHLVAERLADDLYEKIKDDVLEQFNVRQMVRHTLRKFEGLLAVKLKHILKDKI